MGQPEPPIASLPPAASDNIIQTASLHRQDLLSLGHELQQEEHRRHCLPWHCGVSWTAGKGRNSKRFLSSFDGSLRV